jgi:hypothetical protein
VLSSSSIPFQYFIFGDLETPGLRGARPTKPRGT